ncbi:unnamed protein product, partial [marine sediment metagenome]
MISDFWGIEARSSVELYGIGVSSPATIFTGAFRYSNTLSVTLALISEATEPLLHASLTIISLPVFLTEFITSSISRGTSVLGSTTSQLMPSLTGYRPIVEIMFIDFTALAMDQIANQASKIHF